jgi:hypothetical protein
VSLALPNLVFAAVALPGKTVFFAKMFDGYRLAREAEIAAPVPARAVVVALDDLFPLQLLAVRALEHGRTARGAPPDRPRRGRHPRRARRLGELGSGILSMASAAHRRGAHVVHDRHRA